MARSARPADERVRPRGERYRRLAGKGAIQRLLEGGCGGRHHAPPWWNAYTRPAGQRRSDRRLAGARQPGENVLIGHIEERLEHRVHPRRAGECASAKRPRSRSTSRMPRCHARKRTRFRRMATSSSSAFDDPPDAIVHGAGPFRPVAGGGSRYSVITARCGGAASRYQGSGGRPRSSQIGRAGVSPANCLTPNSRSATHSPATKRCRNATPPASSPSLPSPDSLRCTR